MLGRLPGQSCTACARSRLQISCADSGERSQSGGGVIVLFHLLDAMRLPNLHCQAAYDEQRLIAGISIKAAAGCKLTSSQRLRKRHDLGADTRGDADAVSFGHK
jgi:hypothetical protein